MTNADRAKQFAPFAALKDLEGFVLSRQDRTVERIELGEDAQEELDQSLREIQAGDIIELCYYSGGHYVKAAGRVKRIDPEQRLLQLAEKKISLDELLSVQKTEGEHGT